jgi:hypothetical protein
MSAMLNIDVEAVEAVLLADGWHDVIDASFDVDFYEFNESAGFIFTDAESGRRRTLVGPLTSVLALRLKPR